MDRRFVIFIGLRTAGCAQIRSSKESDKTARHIGLIRIAKMGENIRGGVMGVEGSV
jgi:hypothetical protein